VHFCPNNPNIFAKVFQLAFIRRSKRKLFGEAYYFPQTRTMTLHINAAMREGLKKLAPWWDLNSTSFCSGGGRNDHYATPPGQNIFYFTQVKKHLLRNEI
jgi:hypothetical protein